MKSKPITKQHMSDWIDASNQAAKLENDIIDRISFVLNFMFNTFGGSIDTWYFENAAEGSVGDLSPNMADDCIYGFEIEEKKRVSQEITIIDKFDNEWSWEGELPLRWLFEDTFEAEIINGQKAYIEKEAARKLKQKEQSAAKKKEDKDIVEQLKAKLSKRELAALKRSL